MTERHWKALVWILGDLWEDTGERSDVPFTDAEQDILCGEIKRALLKREDVRWITVYLGPGVVPHKEHDFCTAQIGGLDTGTDPHTGRATDKLTALLEATAKLHEAHREGGK